MGLEDVVGWVLSGVKVVHVDQVQEHASEKMSTVREDDLIAPLDCDVFVLLDVLVKHVHHPDAIEETDNDLEASRVEGYTHGIFLELLVNLKL